MATSNLPTNSRNIEIKVRLGTDENFEKKIAIAKKLTSSEAELIVQRDIFFKSASGRLKLRYIENAKAQLVVYDRQNTRGPKLSKYTKIEVEEPEILENILAICNGTLGTLSKKRYLFIHEQTRIHLDKVDNLGNFLEFEVCLRPDQTIAEGRAIAEDLRKLFEIKEEDLMLGSYFDELTKSK